MSLLKLKQGDTNGKLGATAVAGGLVALYAAGFFFGPAALASCALYSWLTAGTATAALAAGGVLGGAATVGCGGAAVGKGILEGSQFKKGKTPIMIRFSKRLLTGFGSCSGTAGEVFPGVNYEAGFLRGCLLAREDLAYGL
jgi:hypothetical protein